MSRRFRSENFIAFAQPKASFVAAVRSGNAGQDNDHKFGPLFTATSLVGKKKSKKSAPMKALQKKCVASSQSVPADVSEAGATFLQVLKAIRGDVDAHLVNHFQWNLYDDILKELLPIMKGGNHE